MFDCSPTAFIALLYSYIADDSAPPPLQTRIMAARQIVAEGCFRVGLSVALPFCLPTCGTWEAAISRFLTFLSGPVVLCHSDTTGQSPASPRLRGHGHPPAIGNFVRSQPPQGFQLACRVGHCGNERLNDSRVFSLPQTNGTCQPRPALEDTCLATETCEELFTPDAPHIKLSLDGATSKPLATLVCHVSVVLICHI